MVQVFSEPLSRRQYAHWISHAVVYRVLSWLSTRELQSDLAILFKCTYSDAFVDSKHALIGMFRAPPINRFECFLPNSMRRAHVDRIRRGTTTVAQ